ncbi:hypothetical protein VQH23_22620 [Pararoseomonas sp. SCSIO 73927]|uniref:hypothetical protein n=1 Tax=Pararoseomonas sp. SCSIO 73927 TaxID=3114537 RepID=UPI0030D22CE4
MSRLGRTALLGPLLLALCALAAGIAVHAAWSLLDGLASGAEWIDVNTGAAGGLPGAFVLGCWSSILLGLRMTPRTERRLMTLSLLCVPLIVLLPPILMPVVHSIMTERGYERCPSPLGRRFPGDRYVRGAPGACP